MYEFVKCINYLHCDTFERKYILFSLGIADKLDHAKCTILTALKEQN